MVATVKIDNTHGDTLSKLLQAASREYGVDNFRFSGHGFEDTRMLMCELANALTTRNLLLQAQADLVKLSQQVQLPEIIHASIVGTFLHAAVLMEMTKKVHVPISQPQGFIT